MRWFDCFTESMPPQGSISIIIKGKEIMPLKEKYKVDDCFPSITVHFVRILNYGLNYDSYDGHQLKDSIILKHEIECCNDKEHELKIRKLLDDDRLNYFTLNAKDIIDERHSWTHDLNSIEYWAFFDCPDKKQSHYI